MNNNLLWEKILKIEEKLIATRRYLHSNPELSFEEYNTMNYISERLSDLGIEYKNGIAKTGTMAIIRGEKISQTPKTLLIRADMDALPIYENSTKEYASKNDGVMHACGHDAHTAILLALCEVLNEAKDSFSGCVKMVFQPAEEGAGGAEPMINEGILENPTVDVCLALHMDTDIETGKIRIKPSSLYASPDDFTIIVKGKGGHGAEPHNCIDPINISAHIISALMTIVSREIDPSEQAVVTIGSIHAGSAHNIIPDTAEIKGTARSMNKNVREFLKNRIGRISTSICESFGAECDYSFIKAYPPLVNDKNLSKKLYDLSCDILGEDNCIYGGPTTMAGEDFAYFAERLPSVLFKLGCRNEEKSCVYPLHHSSFDIDEASLKYGLAVFAKFALDFLN